MGKINPAISKDVDSSQVLAANSASSRASPSTRLHRHPITRSISQTDGIGLIMVHAMEYCATTQRQPASLDGPLCPQPFQKFRLRGPRYLAARPFRPFWATVLRYAGQIPGQFGKSRKSLRVRRSHRPSRSSADSNDERYTDKPITSTRTPSSG